MILSAKIPNTRRFIHAAAAGICLVVTVLGYFVGIRPGIAAETLRAAQAEQIQGQTDEIHDMQDASAKLDERLRTTTEELQVRAGKPQPMDQLNRQLATITDLAAASGSTIHKLQSGQPIVSDLYTVIPIQVAGTGTYLTCTDLLHQLHQACPDLGVTSLELTGQPNSGTNRVGFSLQFYWYTSGPKSGLKN